MATALGFAAGSNSAGSQRRREQTIFTREEVARHRTKDDCWIVIGDGVYDVTPWLALHPGRAGPILRRAGQDASQAFAHFHAPDILEKYGEPLRIGSIEGDATQPYSAGVLSAASQGSERSMVRTEYDFVVVGAGSAGCLLAARLANAGHSVCLLEAGREIDESTDNEGEVSDPMKYGASFGTELNWGFATVSQTHALGRHIRQTRGRGVGGCSLVNGMLYNRGAPAVYDSWGGDWSAANSLPFFRRFEDDGTGGSFWHGGEGEVKLSKIPPSRRSVIASAFEAACVEAGHALNLDQNSLDPSRSQRGVQIYQCYVDPATGQRMTSAAAFVERKKRSTNLTLIPSASATQVMIEPVDSNTSRNPASSDKLTQGRWIWPARVRKPSCSFDSARCTGIIFRHGPNGAEQLAVARKEVVLSAGVIGSPQLLMLSGIGSSDELACCGIVPKIHLPGVGCHYIDHPRVAVRWALPENVSPIDLSTCFSHVEGNLYADSKQPKPPGQPWPDLQIQQDHVRTNDDLLADPPASTGFNLKPHVVSPQSEGTIRLDPQDPAGKPVIDPQYLSDPRDLHVLVDGIKLCRQVVSQKAFDGVRGEELQPGPDVNTDAELKAWIAANVDTGYHPVGSCKMGSRWQDGAVVDFELKVHKVAGLRVVDASVFPTIPNGNTQAATFMVAERAAEMMLQSASAVRG
eukprot:SAG31_NODE_1109_length_9860_cov_22.119353_4_plen_689_part_00